MKYALIFWWVSLAANPMMMGQRIPVGTNVGGAIRQDSVRLFETAEECTAAQTAEETAHAADVKLLSVCAAAGPTYVLRGVAQ